MKEEIRARCPLCGGEIIVSEYYQTSRDYKVLMNGKLSKRSHKFDDSIMRQFLRRILGA